MSVRLEAALSSITVTYLLGGDGLLARLAELLNRLGIITEILLAADKDDGNIFAEMHHLRNPLCSESHVSLNCIFGQAEKASVLPGVAGWEGCVFAG